MLEGQDSRVGESGLQVGTRSDDRAGRSGISSQLEETVVKEHPS